MEEKGEKVDGGGLSFVNCGNSTRYIIMIVSIFALSFTMANSLALNFTVICMYKTSPSLFTPNSTHEQEQEEQRELLYETNQQSWLFSAIAVGNILGTLPLPYSTNQFGVRKTFTFYGFVSGFGTFVLPFLVPFGFGFVFIIRILEGFGVAICFTSLGAIVSSWSTLKGNGTYIALLSCHFQIGAVIAMAVGGEFCSNSYGWANVYYILGLGTILSFSLFFFFYRDTPDLHKNVSDRELRKISIGKIHIPKNENIIPYRAILTDLPVIGILVSCFGIGVGLQTLFQYGPIYLNKVLGFNVKETGFAAALPFVLAIGVKFVVGPFSNLFTFLSEKGKVIFFNSLSQFPMCLCFLSMAILPANMIWLIQIAYSLVNAFAGLGAVGISKSVNLISQHHAHFIMTAGSFVNSFVILFLPFFITSMAPDNTSQQWSRIFYCLTFFIFCTMMFFNLTAKAESRSWAFHCPASKVGDIPENIPEPKRRFSELGSYVARL